LAARLIVLEPLGRWASIAVSLPTRIELAKIAGTTKNRLSDFMRKGVVRNASWSSSRFFGRALTWIGV